MSAHSLNEVISVLTEQIRKIEKIVLKEISIKDGFGELLTVKEDLKR